MEQITSDDYMMLKNRACEQIKQYITTNKLQSGAKLPTERDLAETLGVSRTVIREALGTLETLGYISKRQGKGIFVKEPDLTPLFHEMLTYWSAEEQHLSAIVKFRIMLEQAAIETIIDRATLSELKRLDEIIDQSEQTNVSYKEFVKLDYAFHRELLSLTDNPLFIQLTDVINRYFELLASKVSSPDHIANAAITNQEHRELVRLLKAKDKASAVRLLVQHLT